MRKVAAVWLGIWLTGCSSETVRVDESDSGHTVMLAVEQDLIVALASNASTGYSWSYEATRDGIVSFNGSEYVPTRPPTPGSAGQNRFRFSGATSGETALRFEYRRPWETDRPAAQVVTFDVVVR